MKWLKKPTSINPFFFTFFLFLKQSLCAHPDYEACVPRSCNENGPNISYPFFIHGLQNSTCAYPGLELHCQNGSTILRISDNDFRVLNIDYDKGNLRLQNTAILPNQTVSCFLNIRNLTLDPSRFLIDNVTTAKLVFISNCLNNTNPILDRYRIRSCSQRNRELVMLAKDTNLITAREICGGGSGIVMTPVELGGGEVVVDGENYATVMKRGFVLSWLAAECDTCRNSGGRCGFNTTAFQFSCFCPDRPHRVRCRPDPKKDPKPVIIADPKKVHKPVIIAVVCGSVFAFAVIAVLFIIRRCYKRKAFAYFSSKDKSRDLEDSSVFGVPVFSYTELQDATQNFDTSQELGDGGFGTVYYGKLRDGREVAVKRLYEHNYKRVQQFKNEVDILTRLRHKHLVSLYGCTSRRSRELLLVYEYISNGTVADHLHGELVKTTPLTWPIRIKIAIETASALVYLHASDIIHRDVKTNNILLDNNFSVKVADFGLSRLLPNDVTHVSTAPQGTPGYVDPEYHQCYQLTDKSDVYSFGVVLIELISSMPAIDISRSREEISLANMAINRIQKCALDELIDPFLRSDSDTERMTKLVAELAFRCLQFDSDSRPTMIEVLEVLKGIQGDEIENMGELKSCMIKPPASPEIENVGLLKGLITASPMSVTAKWHSTSSGVTTPKTSV